MKATNLSSLLIACALLMTTGAGSSQAGAQQPPKESAVSVIKIEKKPHTKQSIKLVKEMTIGTSVKDAEEFFEELQAILVDESGNIYALDGRAQIVKVFTKDGRFIHTIGRSGQGPGEFEGPSGIQLTSKGEIFIRSRGRFSFFSLDGKCLRQQNVMTWDTNPVPDRQGRFIGLGFSPTEERGVFNNQLTIFGADYVPIKVITGYKSSMKSDTEIQPVWPKRILYTRLSNGTIVWGINQEYVVNITDEEGTLLRSFERDYDRIEITNKVKQSVLDRFNRVAPGGHWEFPKYYFPMYDLHTDDANHIIVQTYEHYRSPFRKYEVYDVNGKYLVDFILDGNLAYWKIDRIYSIKESDEGVSKIDRYRVVWNK
jgi:hypothetical protein